MPELANPNFSETSPKIVSPPPAIPLSEPEFNQAINSSGVSETIDSMTHSPSLEMTSADGHSAPPPGPPISVRSRTSLKWILPVGLVLLVCLGAAYWYINSIFQSRVTSDHAEHMNMSPSVHEIVHVRQKLVVGTENTYQPMEFIDPQSNSLVGFDIDLAKEIAKEINVPVEFKFIKFDDFFGQSQLGQPNSLTSGDIDLLIDSVTITDMRQQHYSFSNPYLKVGQVALTTRKSTIKTGEDLHGKKIATESSTSNAELAAQLTGSSNVLAFDDFPSAAQAVIDGRADAILTDITNAKGILATHPELRIATDPLTDDQYGIAISKSKADLQKEINRILKVLEARGTLENLKQKWLE